MDRFDILLKIIDESQKFDSYISIDQSIYKDDDDGYLKKIYKASIDSNILRHKRQVFEFSRLKIIFKFPN